MFKKILVPVDLQDNPLAERALAIAVEQAQAADGELIAMSVEPGFGMPIVASFFPRDQLQSALDAVHKELRGLIDGALPAGLRSRVLVVEGHPAECIVEQAEKQAVDLIVMPSTSRRLERRLLGSCASRVVEMAHCPVLVVKG